MTIREVIKLCETLGRNCIENGLHYYIQNDKVEVCCVDDHIEVATIREWVEIIKAYGFNNCVHLKEVYIYLIV